MTLVTARHWKPKHKPTPHSSALQCTPAPVGRKERTARKILQEIREKLGKQKWEFVSIKEFCDYIGLKEEDVKNQMLY